MTGKIEVYEFFRKYELVPRRSGRMVHDGSCGDCEDANLELETRHGISYRMADAGVMVR